MKRLNHRRPDSGREFFRIHCDEAISVVSAVAASFLLEATATPGDATSVTCVDPACRYILPGSYPRRFWICPKCGTPNQRGEASETSAERFRASCENPECAHTIIHDAHMWAWICPACGKATDVVPPTPEKRVMRVCARPDCATQVAVSSQMWAWLCPTCGTTNDVGQSS